MNPLRNSAGSSDEGTDRLWRLLNIVLIAGSVCATVLAVGVVIALFFWLYTLPPVEPERVSHSTPAARQAQPAPKAPEPEAAADPAPQGLAAAAVPPATAPAPSPAASPADPEAAQRAASTRRQRSRR